MKLTWTPTDTVFALFYLVVAAVAVISPDAAFCLSAGAVVATLPVS